LGETRPMKLLGTLLALVFISLSSQAETLKSAVKKSTQALNFGQVFGEGPLSCRDRFQTACSPLMKEKILVMFKGPLLNSSNSKTVPFNKCEIDKQVKDLNARKKTVVFQSSKESDEFFSSRPEFSTGYSYHDVLKSCKDSDAFLQGILDEIDRKDFDKEKLKKLMVAQFHYDNEKIKRGLNESITAFSSIDLLFDDSKFDDLDCENIHHKDTRNKCSEFQACHGKSAEVTQAREEYWENKSLKAMDSIRNLVQVDEEIEKYEKSVLDTDMHYDFTEDDDITFAEKVAKLEVQITPESEEGKKLTNEQLVKAKEMHKNASILLQQKQYIQSSNAWMQGEVFTDGVSGHKELEDFISTYKKSIKQQETELIGRVNENTLLNKVDLTSDGSSENAALSLVKGFGDSYKKSAIPRNNKRIASLQKELTPKFTTFKNDLQKSLKKQFRVTRDKLADKIKRHDKVARCLEVEGEDCTESNVDDIDELDYDLPAKGFNKSIIRKDKKILADPYFNNMSCLHFVAETNKNASKSAIEAGVTALLSAGTGGLFAIVKGGAQIATKLIFAANLTADATFFAYEAQGAIKTCAKDKFSPSQIPNSKKGAQCSMANLKVQQAISNTQECTAATLGASLGLVPFLPLAKIIPVEKIAKVFNNPKLARVAGVVDKISTALTKERSLPGLRSNSQPEIPPNGFTDSTGEYTITPQTKYEREWLRNAEDPNLSPSSQPGSLLNNKLPNALQQGTSIKVAGKDIEVGEPIAHQKGHNDVYFSKDKSNIIKRYSEGNPKNYYIEKIMTAYLKKKGYPVAEIAFDDKNLTIVKKYLKGGDISDINPDLNMPDRIKDIIEQKYDNAVKRMKELSKGSELSDFVNDAIKNDRSLRQHLDAGDFEIKDLVRLDPSPDNFRWVMNDNGTISVVNIDP
jgi:hypothetical protein